MVIAPEDQEAAMAARAQAATGPWNVDVDVILLDMDVDPAKFQILSYLQNGPDGPLEFHNNHRPGFNIHFNLHDPYETGYRFPGNANKKQAVWSQRGDVENCPENGIWQVFQPIRVEPDRMTLIVYNSNKDPNEGPFGYVLRVTRDDGENYVPLDPGGNNQNGPVV